MLSPEEVNAKRPPLENVCGSAGKWKRRGPLTGKNRSDVPRNLSLARPCGPASTRRLALGGAWRARGRGIGLILTGPLIVRSIVDRATSGPRPASFHRLAVLFLIVAVATQLINMAVAWMATITAWHTTNGIRIRLARHVLGLGHEFHRRHTPGELIQRVDGDVDLGLRLPGSGHPQGRRCVVHVVGMIGVLVVVDWRLAVGAAVYVGATGRRRRQRPASRRRRVVRRDGLVCPPVRRHRGAPRRRPRTCASNGAGAHAMWRFVEDSADALGSAVRRERAFLRMWWGVDGSVAAGSIVSLIASALLVSRHVITVGDAFLLFQYVLLLARPLEDMVDQLETVQKANGAMVRVIDLLAIEPDDPSTKARPCLRAGPLSVEFRDVGFDYGDDQPVLQSTSTSISPPAARSASSGAPAAARPRSSRLLLRLVEPTSGYAALGGVAIATDPDGRAAPSSRADPSGSRTVQRHDPRQRDAVRRDADRRRRSTSALRGAGLGTLADGGIHRPLGAGGAGLSAGEAQLLALARVWLRDPDLVVLDEATARVDPETENAARGGRRPADRGPHDVDHRPPPVDARHVDEIVVLDHGRVVEHGDRVDLADDLESRYRHLLDLAHDEDAPDKVMAR